MGSFYQRHLPHYQPNGYTYFVTFRLANSLPQNILEKIKCERENFLKSIEGVEKQLEKVELYREFQQTYFSKFDSLLGKQESGPLWLKQRAIAKVVYDSLRFYDTKKYDLICFTIMPNHVHLIFTPLNLSTPISSSSKISPAKRPYYEVTQIIANLKKYTARECNKILDRAGDFWQHESYDHVVRNEVSLQRSIRYILNNPVKAKLCDTSEEWEWSYLKDFTS